MWFLIFLISVFGCPSLKASNFTIADQCNSESYTLMHSLPPSGDGALKIFLLNHEAAVDSLIFDNASMLPSVDLVNEEIYSVSFPVRAGSGIYVEKLIFLGSCGGKLVEMLNVFSKEQYREPAEYSTEVYSISVEEKVASFHLTFVVTETSKIVKGSGDESVELLGKSEVTLDAYSLVFCNDDIDINEFTVYGSKKKISGQFLGIVLHDRSYIYVNEEWYQIGQNKVLFR